MGLSHYWTHTCQIRRIDGNKLYIQEALGSKTKKVTTSIYDKSHFDKMIKDNKAKVMDFGIINNERFDMYCSMIENLPYDYYTIIEIAVIRILNLFGINIDKFLSWKIFNKIKIDKNYSTEKRLDCSETIARGLKALKGLDMLSLTNTKKYDRITPQHISLAYDKIQMKKL